MHNLRPGFSTPDPIDEWSFSKLPYMDQKFERYIFKTGVTMKYLIWLNDLKGMGPVKKHEMLRTYGSGEAVFKMFDGRNEDLSKGEGILFDCAACGAYPVLFTVLYEKLRGMPLDEEIANDMPFIVYCRGDIKCGNATAIVGSRRCTEYGKSVTKKIAADLAEKGVTVVSGLAKGVDAYAHTACINTGGYTVAVLGCGIDICFPSENRELYKKISECGLIVSENPPKTPGLPYTFPRRNRIIAALSDQVIVTEAGKKSGALITADYAKKYGRGLYAVPGRIDSPESLGCNRLIAEGKAKFFMYEKDKREDFRETGPKEPEYRQTSLFDAYPESKGTPEQQQLLALIRQSGKHILISKALEMTGLDPTKLFTILTELELNDTIEIRGNEIWLQQ